MTARRVLVTRAQADAAPLAAALRDAGFQPVLLPLLAFTEGKDVAAFADALEQAPRAALVVTSPRALPHVPPAPPERPVLAVGPKTAAGLEHLGHRVVVQARGGVQSLLDELNRSAIDPSGGELLWPTAPSRRPELAEGLARMGVTLRPFEVYRTTFTRPSEEDAREALRDLHAVCHFSPTAVVALSDLLADSQPLESAPLHVAIGDTTADALRMAGFTPAVTCPRPDIATLLDALRAG